MMTVKITSKLIVQVIAALTLTIIVLFFIHNKVEAGVSTYISIPTISLSCPIKKYNTHVFELTRRGDSVVYPNYDLLYLKSGLQHWVYILTGTILITLFMQIKIQFVSEPIFKSKSTDSEGNNSKSLETIVVIISIIGGAFLIYTLWK